jgi:serine/threonine protein kinase/Tol biopolymer transport system component
MPLSPGDKLGPYEIRSLIGKGGMGEVYLGIDTRLGRSVAIKVSSRDFNDRFEREARAISALNHPNICTLYDIGPNYLVMEFVEGELLSKIIERGPLPLDKALSYAVQIVDALAAAHAKRVIHRDIKPGNIMVTRNGVKVLDFGLAKLASERLPSNSENIETITDPITKAGAIMGTLYYMAPEQVEGKPVDERSDIFSFGIVLYEMATGQRPFTGDTQAGILASVLKDPPPLLNVRWPGTPRSLERLVRKCLEKKPEDRWRSAHDLKPALELIDLDVPVASTTSASMSIQVQVPAKETKRKAWLWPALAALFALFAIVVAITAWELWPKPPARVTRFQVTLPENVEFNRYVSVSPDGRKLVFSGTAQRSGLWIRGLDTLEWRKLAGTDGGRSPFWSPDSRYLGFGVDNQLKKIDVVGGPPQTLYTAPSGVSTGTWGRDGVIVFGMLSDPGLYRVSVSGGMPASLTALGRGETRHALPTFLPDGKHFLYLRAGETDATGIYAGSIDAKPSEQSSQRILATKYAVSYVNGNLLFMLDGALMVQPFDAAKLQLRGDAVPVAEHVGTTGSIGIFSVSETGVLAYRSQTGLAGSTLMWFDRQGRRLGAIGNPENYQELTLSPDGSRVVVFRSDNIGEDLWLIDVARGSSARLTTDPANESYPVWSPDGKQIAFASNRGGNMFNLYRKTAGVSGEEELLLTDENSKAPSDWSRDGSFVLYTTRNQNDEDIWVLPMSEGDRKPRKYLGTQFRERNGVFSPDGRWVAYESEVSGRGEIYASSFPDAGAAPAVLVSTAGGRLSRWRADGRELYYVSPDSKMMAVDVVPGSSFKASLPKPLFDLPAVTTNDPFAWTWAVTPDGKRFLVEIATDRSNTQAPITVVLNWEADVKK